MKSSPRFIRTTSHCTITVYEPDCARPVFSWTDFSWIGERVQLLVCRQELLPYTGFAMPPRVLRRDAEILKREFHCNAVRCSHYPQSPAFLDACDELGLMVWEELPGWHYIGNQAWQDLAVRDVQDMVRRRPEPSVGNYLGRAHQ